MNSHKLVRIAALVVFLCFILAVAVEHAEATKGDQSLAGRKGIGGALQTTKKKDDEGEGPTKTQMAIGLGSVVVAFIVVKWL